MQQIAQAIAAAIKAGQTVVIEAKASDQVIEQLDLAEGQCHSNAKKFTREHGGAVVPGWLVRQHDLFVTHSIVSLAGVHYEVTRGMEVPYKFVAASDVPDVSWKSDDSHIWLQPEESHQTLLGG